jgi:hypothetical protein
LCDPSIKRRLVSAESFAAAWYAVLAEPRRVRKSTHEMLWHRLFYGRLKPVLRGGRFAGILTSPDDDALLRLYRSEIRRRRAFRRMDERSR